MTTFSQLKSDVAAWVDKDDLSSQIPTFINNGIQKANRKLRLIDMETISSHKLATGKNYFDLPDRFITLINVFTDTNPETKLTYVTPEQMTLQVKPDGTLPKSYTIVDGKIKTDLLVPLTSNITTKLWISYMRGYPLLENDSDTNWLLQNAYDLMLYLSVMSAEFFIINDERVPKVKALAEEAIDELNVMAEEGRYSGDTLRIRAA